MIVVCGSNTVWVETKNEEGKLEVFAFGSDNYGKSGTNTILPGYQSYMHLSNPHPLAMSPAISIGWGMPEGIPSNIVVKELSCGMDHSAFISGAGMLYTVGSNALKQLCLGHRYNMSTWSRVTTELNAVVESVACGDRHTVFVTVDPEPGERSVWSMGCNARGQLGHGYGQQDEHWDHPEIPFRKIDIPSLNEDFAPGRKVQIAAGGNHTLIANEARVWTCGLTNGWGKEMAVDWQEEGFYEYDRYIVHEIAPKYFDGKKIKFLALGRCHAMVLDEGESLFSWGSSEFGQVGDGTFETRAVPVRLKTPWASKVTMVVAGDMNSVVIAGDQVWTWGLDYGSALHKAIHMLYYSAHGKVVPVSSAPRLLVAKGGEIKDVVAVGAGQKHIAFVTKDGDLWMSGIFAGGIPARVTKTRAGLKFGPIDDPFVPRPNPVRIPKAFFGEKMIGHHALFWMSKLVLYKGLTVRKSPFFIIPDVLLERIIFFATQPVES